MINQQGDDFRPQDNGNNKERAKIAELENNLNILHSEYQELGENHSKLEEAYNAAVSQLQHQHEQGWGG